MDTNEKIKEILKTMATFNVDGDLEDGEAREEFVNYFSEIVNTEDDVAKTFLKELINNMGDILVDMNIMEPVEVTQQSDVDLSDVGGETVDEGYVFKLDVADRANDFLM